MVEMIEANWPLVVAALLIGLLIAWFIFHVSRTTSVTSAKEDVLDEGAAPAARNQALIDSAPSATPEPVVPASPEVAVEPVAATTAAAEPVKAASAVAEDDLTRIKGVGPKLATMLREMGIKSFAQVAGWDAAEIARVDAQLGRFQGRIERDNWVEQAKFLAAGDHAGYAGKFGNLD